MEVLTPRSLDEALRKLFEQQGNRYLRPVEAVRESLREIRQHEQAVRRVNDDEVRMSAAGAYRKVVPNDRVLFEEVLEALRESQLTTAVEARIAQARDQDCHVTTERLDSQFRA